MRKIFGIASYTFVEIFRNKVYYVLVLFSGVMMGSTLLLGSLGGEQKSRMITDLGLAGIEAFSLIIAVFAAVTLIAEEMESRTLYLILTRPVNRSQFVIGRFLGLVAIISVAFILMAAVHLSLMRLEQIPLDSSYAVSLYFAWEKIVLITSVALLFSLFATSTLSAVTFTFFFWVLGHASGEIHYLAQRTSQPLVTWVCRFFYYVTPNFETMNLLDFPAGHAGSRWVWSAGGYGFCYTVVCLALATVLFRKKEF